MSAGHDLAAAVRRHSQAQADAAANTVRLGELRADGGISMLDADVYVDNGVWVKGTGYRVAETLLEPEPGDTVVLVRKRNRWVAVDILQDGSPPHLGETFASLDSRLDALEGGGGTAEVFIGPGTPSGPSNTLWVDTDEPGVDLSDWAGLEARIALLEAAPVWTNLPTLHTNWIHYDQGQYTKVNDPFKTVLCRGELQANVASTGVDGLIFTFPAGFRPVKRTGFAYWSNDSGSARVGYVSTDGTVRSVAGLASPTVINIGTIRFPTV